MYQIKTDFKKLGNTESDSTADLVQFVFKLIYYYFCIILIMLLCQIIIIVINNIRYLLYQMNF